MFVVIVTTATPEITSKQSQPCDSNPCQNGGSCIDANGNYTCMCPVEFEGPNCDVTVGKSTTLAMEAFGGGWCKLIIVSYVM